ncbi:MAG: two-component system response regulator RegA [Alteromonadaceae bacterium]|jgi:two-component system response regulator RegA
MKLLIVEDDMAFSATLVRRLTKHGFDCQERHQADQALRACHQFKPDYLILDMILASDNGLMLIKPIRALLPNIHIILLTGYASIVTAVGAINLGANDYLAKPVDTKMLLKALIGSSSEQSKMLSENEPDNKPMSTERLEWEHINQVLNTNDGNVSETARQLGMHRRTLQRKLQKKPTFN